MSTPAQVALEEAIADAIQHLRESAIGLGAELRVEIESSADIARDTAAEVIVGTITVEQGRRNLERLADQLTSLLLANGHAEQARQAAWFKAWAVGLLRVVVAG